MSTVSRAIQFSMSLQDKKFSLSLQQVEDGSTILRKFNAEGRLIEKSTFHSIKDKALQLELLASKVGGQIATKSSLAQLIRSAKELSEKCEHGELEVQRTLIYEVANFNRVADAILPLEGTPHFKRYLTMLTRGKLPPFTHKRTEASDYLWEIELLSQLRKCSITAEPSEPDIVASFEGVKLGIACKKVYSQANLSKTLSNGVKQIKNSREAGFVAFDISPSENVLRFAHKTEARTYLDNIVRDFITQHEHLFKKYLTAGRSLFAFVSTSALIEIGANELANTMRSTSIWFIPGVSPESEALFKRFFDKVMS